MVDLIIRPTAKYIMLGAIIAVLVFVAVEIAWYTLWRENPNLQYVPMLAPLVLIWPAWRALGRQFTTTIVTGDRLRHQTGALTKSTRILQLSKLQDVRVDQSITQRLFHVGKVSIETSGETSRLDLENVDNPQAIADVILNRAQLPGPPREA